MARIFLSYDREDAARARPIARALEKAGHAVWWDQVIKPGAQYGQEIEQALHNAEAVVVLWSKQSIDSAWVRDEAAAARDSGKLVPVLLDQSAPPMGFRQFQGISLAAAAGRGRAGQLDKLLDAVADATTGRAPPAAPAATASAARRFDRRWLLAPLLAALLIVAGLAFWRPGASASAVPLVAVTAADPSPATKAWARDLLVKLAILQNANADALRLIDQGSSERPDLIFEIGGAMQTSNAEASLVLRNGRDRSVLWSDDFQQEGVKAADLRHQVAYTAAQVLRCAAEGMGAEGKPLDQQLLKLYLSGCSALTASDSIEPFQPIFLQITRAAPAFEGAWSKLLSIEARMSTRRGGPERERIRQSLRKHIAEARKLNPHLAEAYFGEAELLPGKALFERMALLDRAVDHNPQNPEALIHRSSGLVMVGRVNDAVEDSRRAAALDPLSQATRDHYIFMLINARLTDRANQELAKAERLWPGATNLANTRFYRDLSFGDPQAALRNLESQRFEVGSAWAMYEPYLRARIEPSPNNVATALAKARSVTATDPIALTMLLQVYATLASQDELFDMVMRAPPGAARLVNHVIFRPYFRDFWRQPRAMQVAARLGLVDYWRRSGQWPDFCTDAPYNCQAEAAKFVRTT